MDLPLRNEFYPLRFWLMVTGPAAASKPWQVNAESFSEAWLPPVREQVNVTSPVAASTVTHLNGSDSLCLT